MEGAKCAGDGFEERKAKRASSEGEGSDVCSAAVALDKSFRLVVGIVSLGGVSSLDAYPAHFLPKLAHRRQFGFVSSHFTRRALFGHPISTSEHGLITLL